MEKTTMSVQELAAQMGIKLPKAPYCTLFCTKFNSLFGAIFYSFLSEDLHIVS